MLNTQQKEYNNVCEKFQSAEQLWFWFLYSKSIQNGIHRPVSSIRRPCELLDVETLITKLYLSGKLTDEQLDVLKKYGDKRRAPHQYIYAENKAAALWNSAMEIIKSSAYKKGWLAD